MSLSPQPLPSKSDQNPVVDTRKLFPGFVTENLVMTQERFVPGSVTAKLVEHTRKVCQQTSQIPAHSTVSNITNCDDHIYIPKIPIHLFNNNKKDIFQAHMFSPNRPCPSLTVSPTFSPTLSPSPANRLYPLQISHYLLAM